MMINDVIDERPFFLKMIFQTEGIDSIRIMRGASVNKQYGPGLPEEAPKTEMNKVSRRNSSSAQASAAASEELNAQAESLNDIVLQLKTIVEGSAHLYR